MDTHEAKQSGGFEEVVVTSPESMGAVGDLLVAALRANPTASVVGLSGELGAGKTTFVRTFLSRIGASDRASSPTFVIRKSYPVPAGSVLANRFSLVSHVDAYRLDRPEDAAAVGILADATRPDVLLLVEWPERVGDALAGEAYLGTLKFRHVSETERGVRLE